MRKMLTVRCIQCGKEIISQVGKTQSCGCPNMMVVNEDTVTAVDLTKTVMVRFNQVKEKNALSSQDLAYQEQRRKRKVRKLDFEIR